MKTTLALIATIALLGCGTEASDYGYPYLNHYPQDQYGVICYYDDRAPQTSLSCVKVTP